eukprot:CAMPEP_0196660500 /NCGR_PEP_ID=MMETSP1086-20130531/40095_1 /TAXON_ID=77921 /ORGANISM="Cyanoptyche  gloeocystis , Strain SAG4.97" /LENGTH=318 /DNA_ID=CAMNT_0041994943 /DNA_START=312 /DNA_END=1266 /DNA_ORIENTATION=-
MAVPLRNVMRERKDELKIPFKLTACEDPLLPESDTTLDLLVFPEGRRYRGVTAGQMPDFVEDVVINGKQSDRVPNEPLPTKRYMFVCVHNAKDARCGSAGPPLIAELRRQLDALGKGESHGGPDSVVVRGCSHIGGHKWAGNVLVYPVGDWYGTVKAEHTKDLQLVVRQAVSQSTDAHSDADSDPLLVRHLWRGRLGLDKDAQTALLNKWIAASPLCSATKAADASAAVPTETPAVHANGQAAEASLGSKLLNTITLGYQARRQNRRPRPYADGALTKVRRFTFVVSLTTDVRLTRYARLGQSVEVQKVETSSLIEKW